MDLTYLRDILNFEDNNLTDIKVTMVELISRTNSLKYDVKKLLEDKSVHFNPLLKENNKLQSKAQKLINEMIIEEDKIEKEIKLELDICNSELQTLSYSLKEINLFLKILKELIEIDSLIKKAKIQMNNGEYYECAQIIFNIQEAGKIYSEKLKEIEVYKVLSQEIILTNEQLLYKISEIWSECVNIVVKENLIQNLVVITLFIKTKSIKEVTEIAKASLHLNCNLIEQKFSHNLLNNILIKIIKRKTKVIINVDDDATLSVEVLNTEEKSHYLEVFDNLKMVINFLNLHLNFEIQNSKKFLLKIGKYISFEFADNLIKYCLSETIPSSSEDLNKYKDVIKNTEEFEKVLQNVGFLPENSSSLLDYANNINVLFANKFCQTFLNKARNICKKDLHNTSISEEVESNITTLPLVHRNILRDKMNIQDEIFLFPKCQISKQADEIINLINLMIKEIEKSEDLCAVRLFYTVRNIFEMYVAVVPLHHQKFLETLPQQVALFHNNCMYFAHKLIYLTIEFYKKKPTILKDHLTILLEEAVVLRSLAAESLEKTVTNQKNQLIYILRISGFALLNDDPKLDPHSEKSIRQCMRQLQILHTVWIDILPINMYNRAIGFLLDAVVEEIMNLILAVEDISSQTASELVSSFNIILERSPKIFPEEKEIHRHVKKWQKFKEFILIIKGTLRDIDDRWANGLGPLAIEFTAEQVKHLIRALFQNSDRRAALLARIR